MGAVRPVVEMVVAEAMRDSLTIMGPAEVLETGPTEEPVVTPSVTI